MPRPRTPKEIKQFLGLTGYYRKFVPRFSEIARPLTKLTAKDTSFEWTPQCQFSFEMLKNALMSAPILKYPDTEKPYTIFTDASNYGWAGVLTQEHTFCRRWKRSDNKPPCGICQWNVLWQSIKLGRHDKRGIHNLYDY